MIDSQYLESRNNSALSRSENGLETLSNIGFSHKIRNAETGQVYGKSSLGSIFTPLENQPEAEPIDVATAGPIRQHLQGADPFFKPLIQPDPTAGIPKPSEPDSSATAGIPSPSEPHELHDGEAKSFEPSLLESLFETGTTVAKETGKATFGAIVDTSDAVNALLGLGDYEFPGPKIDPDLITPETTGGQIAQDLIQFTGGGIVGTSVKFARNANFLKSVSDDIITSLKFLLGGTTAMGPEAENLGDLADSIGNLNNPAAEAFRKALIWGLKKDVDDSTFEKMLKNYAGVAIEEVMILPLVLKFGEIKAWLKTRPKQLPAVMIPGVIDVDNSSMNEYAAETEMTNIVNEIENNKVELLQLLGQVSLESEEDLEQFNNDKFEALGIGPGSQNQYVIHNPQEPVQVAVTGFGSSLIRKILRRTEEIEGTTVPENVTIRPGVKPPESDFNFERMNTTDDMQLQMEEVSQFYSEQITEATRGELRHEAIEDLANMLDWTPEDILKREQGGTFNAEQMLASRKLLLTSLDKLTEQANKIARGGTDEDKLAFFRQLNLHAAMQAQVKGAQTEIARSLGQFNIQATGLDRSVELERFLTDITKGGNVSEIAQQFLSLPDARSMNNYARNITKATSTDMFFEVWINALLSNPATHAVNVASNALFSLWSIPEHILAAGLGKSRNMVTGSQDRVRVQEAMATVRAMNRGTKEGFAFAWEAFRKDQVHSNFTKLEGIDKQKITAANFNLDENSIAGRGVDYLGHFVRLPGRFLMAEDDFFKALNYRIETERMATRKVQNALDNGATKEEANKLYRDIIENGDPEIHVRSVEYAREMTFTKELGTFGKWLDQGRFKFPVMRVFMPFLRAPTNLIKEAGARSPIGFFMPSVQKELAAGGARRDLALAKIGLGSSVSTWAAQWSAEEKITGGGPGTPNLKRTLEATGWRPYSFVFEANTVSDETLANLKEVGIDTSLYEDKLYISYERIEPFATLLGVMADASDFTKYADNEDDANTVAMHALGAILHNLGSKTWMQGVASMSNAFDDPDTFLSSYAKNMAGSLVPAGVNVVTRQMDPTKRETRADPALSAPRQAFNSILNGIKARTPGYAEDLPPKLGPWGEEMTYGKGKWYEIVSPFRTSNGSQSAIDKELLRLGHPMSLPTRQIEGIDLTPEQYNAYVKIMHKETLDPNTGKNLRRTLDALVKAPGYKRLSDEEKIDHITNIRNKFQSISAQRMIAGDRRLRTSKMKKLIEEIDAREAARMGVMP